MRRPRPRDLPARTRRRLPATQSTRQPTARHVPADLRHRVAATPLAGPLGPPRAARCSALARSILGTRRPPSRHPLASLLACACVLPFLLPPPWWCIRQGPCHVSGVLMRARGVRRRAAGRRSTADGRWASVVKWRPWGWRTLGVGRPRAGVQSPEAARAAYESSGGQPVVRGGLHCGVVLCRLVCARRPPQNVGTTEVSRPRPLC